MIWRKRRLCRERRPRRSVF